MQLSGARCQTCGRSIEFTNDGVGCSLCRSVFNKECLESPEVCPNCRMLLPEKHDKQRAQNVAAGGSNRIARRVILGLLVALLFALLARRPWFGEGTSPQDSTSPRTTRGGLPGRTTQRNAALMTHDRPDRSTVALHRAKTGSARTGDAAARAATSFRNAKAAVAPSKGQSGELYCFDANGKFGLCVMPDVSLAKVAGGSFVPGVRPDFLGDHPRRSPDQSVARLEGQMARRGLFVVGSGEGARLTDRDDVVWVLPVLSSASSGNTPFFLTDEVVVRFQPTVTRLDAEALVTEQGCVVHEWNRRVNGLCLLRVEEPESLMTLSVANGLAEASVVRYSHPNFIVPKQIYGRSDTSGRDPDPLYSSKQWHLDGDVDKGASEGADINTEAAWSAGGEGSASIRVAVIDFDGVDRNHPDLLPCWTGRNYQELGDGQPTDDPSPTRDDEDHGTCVAGCAVAAANDIGVRGVAPGCGLIGIKADIDQYWLAEAFYFAVDPDEDGDHSDGAAVIINSWGIGTYAPTVLVDAIQSAASDGRDGKGCLVLFAAGNNGHTVDGVSALAQLDCVICVGASNSYGEHSEYSDVGPEVDVVAPSGDGGDDGIRQRDALRIWTTDVTGENGYDESDYTEFSGTSAATPICAGVAALVLSQNPDLTGGEVRGILEHTAVPMDAPYDRRDPVTGHSHRFGYGKVDAAAAVLAAKAKDVWPEPVSNLTCSSVEQGVDLAWGNPDENHARTLVVRSRAPLNWAPTDGDIYQVGGEPVDGVVVVAMLDAKSAFTDETTLTGAFFYGVFACSVDDLYSWGSKCRCRRGTLVLFYDDCESADPGWTHGGTGDNWARGVPTSATYGQFTAGSGPLPGRDRDRAIDGNSCWGTGLYGNYPAGAEVYLRTPTIDLPAARSRANGTTFLEFRDWCLLETGYDRCEVRVLGADGSLIGTLEDDGGGDYDWTRRVFDISDYAGQQVRIEFRLVSDDKYQRDGWFIDEVEVYTAGALIVSSPVAGEVYETGGALDIQWSVVGEWSTDDRVRVEYSSDGGATWTVIEGAESVDPHSGVFVWDTDGLLAGSYYRLRFVDKATGSTEGDSGVFGFWRYYYVNLADDPNLSDNEWCSAPGADADGFGMSPDKPAATVSWLFSQYDLGPGDTVCVDVGDYALGSNTVVGPDDGGSPAGHVTICGSMVGAGTTLDRGSTTWGRYCFELRGGYIRLERLRLTNAYCGVYLNNTGASGNSIVNCIISHTSYGVQARTTTGSQSVSVVNCTFHENTVAALGEHPTRDGRTVFEIINSVFSESSGDCIQVNPSSGGNSVSISDYNCFHLSGTARAGVRDGDAYPGLADWQDATEQDIHSISADPLFVSPGNGNFDLLYLGSGSPCVDAGTDTVNLGVDMLGTLRPQGAGTDMGAYEATGAPVLFALDVTVLEDVRGGLARVPVLLSWASGEAVQVNFSTHDDTAVAGGDYQGPQSGTLTWSDGQDGTRFVEIGIIRDSEIEPPEAFSVQLSGATNAGVLIPTATVTILSRDVLYVNGAATGRGDGSSWADAFLDLQAALAVASASDEIWVAAGRYTPGTERTDTFQLVVDVALYGGFAGHETTREARDWTANETVLSGDVNGDDGPDFANNDENVYHVVTGADDAVLDGFTIRGGNANGVVNEQTMGGGMHNGSYSPTVSNCTFAANVASLGGGMGNGDESSPMVLNCTFSENSAVTAGGGMFGKQSSLTVTDCVFSGNSARYGGGVLNDDSDATFTNCTFTRNTAQEDGGGMECYLSSTTVSNCTFAGNTAQENGGGVECYLSTTTVSNCVFAGNTARYCGGGMDNYLSLPALTNCTFSGNRATGGYGGGMQNYLSSPALINCTFSLNSAKYGGGVYSSSSSSPTLTNCILWGDRGSTSGPEIRGGTPRVTFSCVAGGFPGQGNTESDPLFLDAERGTLYPRPSSPCVDTGTDVGAPAEDILGTPRPQGAGVDMGVYEVLGEAVDTDNDGLPDYVELAYFGSIQVHAPGVDTDEDGYDDYLEELIDSDPSDGTDPATDGAVAGRVLTDDRATAVDGCPVSAFLAGIRPAYPLLASSTTDASGDYSLAVPAGVEVIVMAHPSLLELPYQRQFYSDADSLEAAQWLSLADRGSIGDVDFILQALPAHPRVLLSASDSEVPQLLLCELAGATTGWDLGLDAWTPEDADGELAYVSFVSGPAGEIGPRCLFVDAREPVPVNRWRVQVDVSHRTEPITLSWELSGVGEDRLAYLQRLVDEACVGPPEDLSKPSSVLVGEDSVFEIVLAPLEERTYTLEKGWNLLGSDIMSPQTIGESLTASSRGPLTSGPGWLWRRGAFGRARTDDPFLPESGYWVYSRTGGQTALLPGTVADGVILLQPGWNLITPAADWQAPRGLLLGRVWFWEAGTAPAWQSLEPWETLPAGRAHWVYLNDGESHLIYTGDVRVPRPATPAPRRPLDHMPPPPPAW